MNISIDPKLLKPKPSAAEPTWRLWEKKNLNMHRGIIEWFVDPEVKSMDELALQVRRVVKSEFSPGWLRGFGFGTVLHVKNVSEDFAQICDHIDRRNTLKGVWQWAIVLFDDDKVAIGIHTWLHGYLRPVFDSIIQILEEDDYECKTSDADVDKLIATISKIHTVCNPLHLFF